MLLAITTPISAGSTPVNGETYDRFLTNIGDLRNRGIEINAFTTTNLDQFRLNSVQISLRTKIKL